MRASDLKLGDFCKHFCDVWRYADKDFAGELCDECLHFDEESGSAWDNVIEAYEEIGS